MLKPTYWTTTTCAMEWLVEEFQTLEEAQASAEANNLKVEIINL